jgi:hypothetical protein
LLNHITTNPFQVYKKYDGLYSTQQTFVNTLVKELYEGSNIIIHHRHTKRYQKSQLQEVQKNYQTWKRHHVNSAFHQYINISPNTALNFLKT